MEPLTGEVFRMPHETELWDTHVLFYRHRIFLHRHAALFLTFRWSGSVPAVRKEKRMYFDAKEFGKRLHDVRTSRGITQEELAVRLGLASKQHVSHMENGERSCSMTCWLNCPASSMSARIIFWWAASQAKRKSKMIFLVLFRSCLRLRRKSKKH